MDLPHLPPDPPPSLPSSLGILLMVFLKINRRKGVYGKDGGDGEDGEDAWHSKSETMLKNIGFIRNDKKASSPSPSSPVCQKPAYVLAVFSMIVCFNPGTHGAPFHASLGPNNGVRLRWMSARERDRGTATSALSTLLCCIQIWTGEPTQPHGSRSKSRAT